MLLIMLTLERRGRDREVWTLGSLFGEGGSVLRVPRATPETKVKVDLPTAQFPIIWMEEKRKFIPGYFRSEEMRL